MGDLVDGDGHYSKKKFKLSKIEISNKISQRKSNCKIKKKNKFKVDDIKHKLIDDRCANMNDNELLTKKLNINNNKYCSNETGTKSKSSKKLKMVNEVQKIVNVKNCSDESLSKEDPYMQHFNKNMSKSKASETDDSSHWKSTHSKWPMLGDVMNFLPEMNMKCTENVKLLLQDEEDNDLPPIGVLLDPPSFPTVSMLNWFLQKQLLNKCKPKFSSFQSEMFAVISRYYDFYYPHATTEKWDKIQLVYSLHCVNHILKARQLITENTEKLKCTKSEQDHLSQDQGFTRPKVLILVPFKHTAYMVIKKIMGFLDLEVQNRKRFENNFGPGEENENKKKADKPEDFKEIFAGDINEDFQIGLKLTKKSLKLYTEYFQSDVIISSPLSLRHLIESAKSPQGVAFLSSIEVLIIDKADILLMQNWEHVLVIRDWLNKVPKNFHQIIPDFCRVRHWCVDGLATYYRQTIIFSSVFIDYNEAFFLKTKNFVGKMQVMNPPGGVLNEVRVRTELTLHCINTEAVAHSSCPDSRFDHFANRVLPYLTKKGLSHTLLYIPDYCDYVRLVSYFKNDGGTSIATINEYMIEEHGKVSKVRSLFFEGKRELLLYTERFHFYRRYKIKGVRQVVFYELPTYPHFFSEICNFMTAENQNPRDAREFLSNNVLVMFQKYDESKLMNVLGVELANQILKSSKRVYKCDIGS